MKENRSAAQSSLKNFAPLWGILLVALLFATARHWQHGHLNWMQAMSDFMGSLLILVGAFKLIHLKGFVETYKAYDIIATRSTLYAYAYPFIELILGALYLAHAFPIPVNAITGILAVINSISVAQALRAKKEISCGCLGTAFELPLTKVTLFENLLMAAMAFAMLVGHVTIIS